MHKRMGALAISFILLFQLFLLSGCGIGAQEAEQAAAQRYHQLWAKRDYQGMYDMLDTVTQRSVTLEDFEQAHQKIYDPIGIESITSEMVGEMRKSETRAYEKFKLTYTAGDYGEVSYDMELPLVKQNGEWKVQWDYSLVLPGMEADDELRTVTTQGKRGEIFTSDGELLAQNGYASTVYVLPDKVEDETALVSSLSTALEMDAEKITEILNSKETQRDGLAIIKAYPYGKMSDELRAQLGEIVGVGIDEQMYTPQRIYPHGDMLAHVIGYMGVASEEELAELDPDIYGADERIGKTGLEAAYESQLRGKNGKEVRLYSSDGRLKMTVCKIAAEDGLDLILNINYKLQSRAEKLLKENIDEGNSGAVVVLNPKTGAVEALASYPTFDLNLFALGIDQATWDQLNDENGNQPLFSRAFQGLYAPGSTIKPFTAAVGMESGAITKDYVFTGNIVNRRWKPDDPSWIYPPITRYTDYAQPYNIENSMMHSDNIYYADVAMKVGSDGFTEYLKKIGFGERMPFDLSVGMAQISNSGEMENEKFLADCGYGQGEMLITPLQLNVLFSCFANGGTAMKPFLVKETRRMEDKDYVLVSTTEPEVYLENIVSEASMEVLQPILRKVVTNGTGISCAPAGMAVSGKTGTAEVGTQKKHEINWFTGYVSDGSFDRAVCVMIDAIDGNTASKSVIAQNMFLP